MQTRIRITDVVALLEDVPAHGLVRGHVGTVVEAYADAAFEVEFNGDDGRAYAQAAVAPADLLVLHHRPVG